MENKYYTPEIKEFRLNFKYEEKDLFKEDKWNSKVISSLTDIEILKGLNSDVRVKYLDKEDIESLGFTDYQHSVENWYKFKNRVECPISNYTYQGLRLRHNYQKSGITITAYEFDFEMEKDEEGVGIFRGIVKNLTELKKVLIQLGISHE